MYSGSVPPAVEWVYFPFKLPGVSTVLFRTLTVSSVVLVHGLSGDLYRTWTYFPTLLWPQMFLPLYPGFDTAGIRVLTFGYDANRGSSINTDINGLSDNLLADLVPERRGLDDASFLFTVCSKRRDNVYSQVVRLSSLRTVLVAF
jgi:hypothetical protein